MSFEEEFINYLNKLKEQKVWTRVRAALRRSLAFEPGAYPAAFPFVEPWVAEQEGWRREVVYLVAGLYALKDGAHVDQRSLAQALREAMEARGSGSIEKRFLALLDADRDQIPHRLRQAVGLVEGGLDFVKLLRDLRYWFDDPRRHVQSRWARDFYTQGRDQGGGT